MAPFYGWGSTASRLEPLRGGSLLFTTKFPISQSVSRRNKFICAAVHTRYVMDAYDRVRSIILLPLIMGMSFLLVVLTRLIVREPKH